MSDQTEAMPPDGAKALRAFAELSAETREALESMGRLRRLRAGQAIVHEGETTEFVGLVASGVLRIQKSLADGRHPIVGLLVEGGIFGRVFDGPAELAIDAATDAEVYLFPRGPFEALLERSPELGKLVLQNTINELDIAHEWMAILSRPKIASRVAGFLIVMCARFADVDHVLTLGQDGMEVRIPLSRIDLADLLGTRPESISRALHQLARAGDIDIIAPDRVLIRNAAALVRKAGEQDLESAVGFLDILRRRGRHR